MSWSGWVYTLPYEQIARTAIATVAQLGVSQRLWIRAIAPEAAPPRGELRWRLADQPRGPSGFCLGLRLPGPDSRSVAKAMLDELERRADGPEDEPRRDERRAIARRINKQRGERVRNPAGISTFLQAVTRRKSS